ncbi:hypothetical protein VP01_10447g1, partial [Puccinia sorghi]
LINFVKLNFSFNLKFSSAHISPKFYVTIFKTPFSYQKIILEAMKAHEHKFLDEERRSDELLFTQKFQHNVQISFIYPSSLPGLQLIKESCKIFLLGEDSISCFPNL